jgi:hypothetical protein
VGGASGAGASGDPGTNDDAGTGFWPALPVANVLCIFDYDLTLSSHACELTEGMSDSFCRQNTCPTYGWYDQCLGAAAREAVAECVNRGAFIGIASHAGVDECWSDKVTPAALEGQFPALTDSPRYGTPSAPDFAYPALDVRANWNCPNCAYHMVPDAFKPNLIGSIMAHYGLDKTSPEDQARVIFWDDSPANITDVNGALPEVHTITVARHGSGEAGGCGLTAEDIEAGWMAVSPVPDP